MRVFSLLLVFVIAKVVVLAGHTVPVSVWALIAYVWQDLLVAAVFAAIEWRLPKRPAWVLYWILAIYAALNVPVGRAMSTPLTWPMLQAARGPLADSILLYVTWQNVVLVMLTLAAAVVLPLILRRVPRSAFAVALPLIAVGPFAANRVDTLGLERNPVATLIATAIPRIGSHAAAGDWRTSPFPQAYAEDFSRFYGAAKGRNVVMVSLESTAAQYLSLYGGESDLTPNLARLAKSALVFDNAYAAYPESIKGLFSVLCATFPAFDSQTEAYANAPCKPLPEVLSEAGYRTALFHSGRFGYLGMESVIQNHGYQTLEDAGDIGGNHNSSFGVDEPATVARMLAWLDAQPRDRPFFLTYLPIAGHHPYETPEPGPFSERDDFGRYRNALLYGDASLGTLMEGLRARGLDRNTVWLIYGDHGEAFGQHEGNYGHTFFLFEENVHVPFIVAAPGLIPDALREHADVSLVDAAPTLLDILGIPVPGAFQGESALNGAPRMALFFADYSLGHLGLRDGRYKFIYEIESARPRLFDLVADPRESTNIALREPARVASYTETLRGWSASQKSYIAQAR